MAKTLEIILLGGGHTHLVAVPTLMRALGGRARVTVVSDRPTLLYSGMMPGWLAGQYAYEDCAIDLARHVEAAGARFVRATVDDVDFVGRTVAGLRFDLLSVNVGSSNAADATNPAAHLGVKPFAGFVAAWQALLAQWAGGRPPRRLTVVGGGAAGVEIAFALAARRRIDPQLRNTDVSLVSAAHRLLVGLAPAAGTLAQGLLSRAGVGIELNRRHVLPTRPGAGSGAPDAAQSSADLTILATGARAPDWLERAATRDGRTVGRDGGLAVRRTMQSVDDPDVFACGDCASFVDEAVPRSGVHALRQAGTLASNLASRAVRQATAGGPARSRTEDALRAWRPQRRTLALLNCGDGTAIGAWGPLGWHGAWAWRWKDRIDRRFIASMRDGPSPAGTG